MALQYSMYGGKPGTTYRLVAHYDSIKEMVDAFQKGGSYNTVNYGEYVIIDTVLRRNLKNNAENGILYRRGYDFNQAFNPHEIPLFPEVPIPCFSADCAHRHRHCHLSINKEGSGRFFYAKTAFSLVAPPD